MKKLLILMFPLMLKAQGIQVVSITPTVLCPGESIKVTYTIKPGNTVLNLIGSEASQVWQYDYSYLTNQPFVVSGPDTVFTIMLKTKVNLGKWPATLKANGSDFALDFSCEYTGIKVHAPDEGQPIYFDLSGQQIEKRVGEVIIEQVGLKRRKLVVQ